MKQETKRELEKTGRISVNEISAKTLSQFIRTQEGNLDFVNLENENDYANVFQTLRSLPIPLQGNLLVNFYTEQVENFPNGEKLGSFLAKINNIQWLRTTGEPEPAKLQQLLDEFYGRLNIVYPRNLWINRGFSEYTPSYTGGNSLWRNWTDRYTTWGAAHHSVWQAAWSNHPFAAKRGATWKAAREAAVGAAPKESWGAEIDARNDAVLCSEWIIVEDVMPKFGYDKGNPFEILFDGIWNKGYWFVGPFRGYTQIFVPTIKKSV